MRLTHLRQRLRDLGAAPCHEGRVLRAWVQRRSLDTRRRRAEDFLPLAVRNDLPALFDELNALADTRSAVRRDEIAPPLERNLLDLLKKQGAEVAYYDPYVPEILPSREHGAWTGTRSVPWNQASIQVLDAAVISTAHKAVNYQHLADWCACIVDTIRSWCSCCNSVSRSARSRSWWL